MIFTYLVDGANDPSQEVMDQHDIFIAVVVLSDEMHRFVMDEIGFELKASNAVCWLVLQKHLRSAAKGSALSRLHDIIKDNNMYTGIEHSFLAFASKKELIDRKGGGYIPLHLHNEDDESARTQKLVSAIRVAIKQTEPRKALLGIDRILSAGKLLATLLH